MERFADKFIVGREHEKWSFKMFKNLHVKTLIAAGMIAASSMALPTVAEAKTRIGIYFGVPFYNGALDNDYLYDQRYGWYAPEYRNQVRLNFGNSRATCRQAARQLRNAGYRKVVARDCTGRTYEFQARKNGRRVNLTYNARTGSFSRS